MLVSVIITCYNLENYIGECIDSVIFQNLDSSMYEIIVVDDCSTDMSKDIIESYKNILYVRTKKNSGVLMATVLGLEQSKGDLVFFLDGDDVWDSDKLSDVLAYFTANPKSSFVTHDLSFIDRNGRLIDQRSQVESAMYVVPPNKIDVTIRDGILLHKDYVWLGSAYAVHRLKGNLNGFCNFARSLPDPFNTYQDWPLAFWVACQPQVSCGYLNRKLLRYRLHGLNHSGDSSSKEKAVRNVLRTFNTMNAITEISNELYCKNNVRKATKRKLGFSLYLLDLYKGNRLRASIGFILSIPYLITGPSLFWKEAIRFIVVQLVGIEYFLGFISFFNKLSK